jgi:hypothetical protein
VFVDEVKLLAERQIDQAWEFDLPTVAKYKGKLRLGYVRDESARKRIVEKRETHPSIVNNQYINKLIKGKFYTCFQ